MMMNLDELIKTPTKVEERSLIQASFRTQDPNIRTGHHAHRNPRLRNLQLIHHPQCFQSRSQSFVPLDQR